MTPAPDDTPDDVRDLLAEQVAYYDARAAEYDLDMWQWGTDDEEVAAHHETALRWFAALPVRGHVLELACGTGAWTGRLAARADHVTAVDAAPAMLQEARGKHGHLDNVDFVRADLLEWEPPGRYDLVFASFFVSHVPVGLAERFWRMAANAMATGGTLAVLDAAPQRADEEDWAAPGVARRRLRDGSSHRVVKVFDHVAGLTPTAHRLGLDIQTQHLSERLWAATLHRGSALRG